MKSCLVSSKFVLPGVLCSDRIVLLKFCLPSPFNVFFKFWTRPIVFFPVRFFFYSAFLSWRFSMTPKILSPNVLSLVGEIGNVIHKTIKVVNIVTSKRSLTNRSMDFHNQYRYSSIMFNTLSRYLCAISRCLLCHTCIQAPIVYFIF